MGNCRFSLGDAARVMGHVRRKVNEDSVDLSAAWQEAEQAFSKMFGITGDDREVCPAGHYLDDRGTLCRITAPKPRVKELDLPPHFPCHVHREKSFTFSDGTTWVCCTHDDCEFGKRTKRHSDGSPGGVYPNLASFPDEIPAVESEDEGVEGVEVAEITVTPARQAPIAGEDEGATSPRNINEFFEGEIEEEPTTGESYEEYENAFNS